METIFSIYPNPQSHPKYKTYPGNIGQSQHKGDTENNDTKGAHLAKGRTEPGTDAPYRPKEPAAPMTGRAAHRLMAPKRT